MTPYFDDWKRFCRALREIAAGASGQPLSGVEAQKRAREVLAEAGYRWLPGGELGAIPEPRSLEKKRRAL